MSIPRFVAYRALTVEQLEERVVPAFFTGVGDVPGGNFRSAAWGISGDGSTVVGNSDYGPNLAEAYRWTKPSGMLGLGLPGVIVNSVANDASTDGSVLVGGHGNEAFRWILGKGMFGLGDLPGGFGSSATGVSGDGSVVVGYSRRSQSYFQAFLWTAGSGMVGLGGLPDWLISSAQGVSADGSVVVGHSISSYRAEAFRWTAGGGMVGLGDLPGAEFSSGAYAASADGSVVVGISASDTGPEAFRWTANGGMVGLDNLDAYPSSIAVAVSANGSVVVGGARFSTGDAAFIWDATHGMRNLRDLLINDYGLGPALAGWRLVVATCISNDGRVIAGNGYDANGRFEGWVANLRTPRPSRGIEVLTEAVKSLAASRVLDPEQENSLIKQLQAAQEAIDVGDFDAAIARLRTFQDEVNRLVDGRVLTEREATPLLETAGLLIDELSGSASRA